VTLDVEVAHRDLARARRDGADRVSRLRAVAAEFGVAPGDVDCVGLQVRSRGDYLVRRTVVLRLREQAKLEELLDRALRAGASGVSSVEFSSSSLSAEQDRARLLAARSALARARALADELGASVGPALAISSEEARPTYGETDEGEDDPAIDRGSGSSGTI